MCIIANIAENILCCECSGFVHYIQLCENNEFIQSRGWSKAEFIKRAYALLQGAEVTAIQSTNEYEEEIT